MMRVPERFGKIRCGQPLDRDKSEFLRENYPLDRGALEEDFLPSEVKEMFAEIKLEISAEEPTHTNVRFLFLAMKVQVELVITQTDYFDKYFE